MSSMVEAMRKEIAIRKLYISPEDAVTSIYFGGGTPSLLSPKDLGLLLEDIYQNFSVEKDVEITLEANPDDIEIARLAEWKALGINRFSMGVQSFFDEDLRWMNRAHDATQSLKSIQNIQVAGFENITVDLIYGTPTLSDAQWEANVQQALSLGIPHLSCYALTVEEGTALHKMIEQQKKENTDEDKQSRQFEYLMSTVRAAGWEHYEVSNFAKPGFRSRHNSGYWQGRHYLGIGPSAHSFNGKSRQWNVANNAKYIQALAQNEIPYEVEWLTSAQQLDEYIMTSLRTMEGLSLAKVEQDWGLSERVRLEKDAQKYIQMNELALVDKRLKVTDKGFLFADGIAASLFSE